MKALASCCKELADAMQAITGRSNIKARILNQEWTELSDQASTAQTDEDIAALNIKAQSLFNRMKELAIQQLSALTF